MAQKATVYKASLAVSDLDRQYYATHVLTLACHPSETEERMMVRLLAFALFASESLQFTRGLSTDDEPDLWDKDLTGHITHWIELGTPDESRIRKGCGRAEKMTIVSYQSRTALPWWTKLADKQEKYGNLKVIFLPNAEVTELGKLAQRNMNLQVTIQDGQIWISDESNTVPISPEIWKQAAS